MGGERRVRGRLHGQASPRLVSSLLRGGQVAQLVEHRTENPGVGGSIPSLPTMFFAYFRAETMGSSSATGRVTGRVGVARPVAPGAPRECDDRGTGLLSV